MFTSPILMAIGGGLVALPIIIHILNRRRFKRVDWAAMDFLLEANRINRRRIQFQDLLLLLLRCLAVLLIAALLARPFFTQDSGGDLRSGRFERVVILDDSPSMDTVDGGETPFTRAKNELETMIKSLAEDTSENTLTLYLSSSPDAPVISGEPIDLETLATRLDSIRSLEVSDVPSDYLRAIESVERSVAKAKQEQNNQMVYILTDFRSADWGEVATDTSTTASEGEEPEGTDSEDAESTSGGTEASEVEKQAGLADALKSLSSQVSGLYLVELDTGETSNVLIESVTSEENIIAGVLTKFTVRVRNTGKSKVENLLVSFKAGRSLPVEREIPEIDAGATKEININYTFTADRRETELDEFPPDKGVPVVVTIFPKNRAKADVLEPDNSFYFPVMVSSGLRSLIVDGDQGVDRRSSDSYFLRKALSPEGRIFSGLAPEVITVGELETTNLNEYKVIYLLNLLEVPEDVIPKLEKWVDAGGGLCIAVGGAVEEGQFNQTLFKDGSGLSPIKLQEIRGDEREESWALFEPLEERHPIFREFEGQNSLLIEAVKVFRWWAVSIDPKSEASGETTVLAKWVPDDEHPLKDEAEIFGPAVVEKRIGKGKVIAFTTPLDMDWNDWPLVRPSYVIGMLETAKYLGDVDSDGGLLQTGQPINMQLDLTRYKVDYKVKPPEGETRAKAAVAPADSKSDGGGELVPWKIVDDGTREKGFYEVTLTSSDRAEPETILFAANLDPAEGDLKLVNVESVQTAMGNAPVSVVKQSKLASLGANTARMELWKPVLYILLGLLVFELFYGWWLGVKRGA